MSTRPADGQPASAQHSTVARTDDLPLVPVPVDARGAQLAERDGLRRLAAAFPLWARDFLSTSWQHLLEPALPRLPEHLHHGTRTPIVLLPGVYQTWVPLSPIAEALNRRGHPIYWFPDLGHNLLPLPESADIVQRGIARERLPEVYLVGHSKGGILGKYLLSHASTALPGVQLRGMTAFSAPFHGSRYSRYMLSPWLRGFQPGRPPISDLDDDTAVNALIISVYGVFDPQIPEGSWLPGARANIPLPVYGHMRILRDTQAVAIAAHLTSQVLGDGHRIGGCANQDPRIQGDVE
ncbi:MAG TPA: alpha/beta hydrolase [Pseudoclavibacter sp.]|nr:alpha/beta hydrolase [Pseudoclavibacter sp.]